MKIVASKLCLFLACSLSFAVPAYSDSTQDVCVPSGWVLEWKGALLHPDGNIPQELVSTRFESKGKEVYYEIIGELDADPLPSAFLTRTLCLKEATKSISLKNKLHGNYFKNVFIASRDNKIFASAKTSVSSDQKTTTLAFEKPLSARLKVSIQLQDVEGKAWGWIGNTF